LFKNCKIVGKPIIYSPSVPSYGLYETFVDNPNLNAFEIHSKSIETLGRARWLQDCSHTGTIYCPSDLTLPENSESGIPSGWTRVDI
jgi:hypothetical protein